MSSVIKCHRHASCVIFLAGSEPRYENPYVSLRSLRSPVQKFCLRGLLLLVQPGSPPATKCHTHTPWAIFLVGTKPPCGNPYASLRSLRSPVQKFCLRGLLF